MNLTKRLRVEPGSKLKLADIDPAFHGKHETEEAAKAELQSNLELQRKLYASRNHCLLIVLQGIDAAGNVLACNERDGPAGGQCRRVQAAVAGGA